METGNAGFEGEKRLCVCVRVCAEEDEDDDTDIDVRSLNVLWIIFVCPFQPQMFFFFSCMGKD